MPGYLTHTKVLIDTVDWLSDIEDTLQQRLWDKKPLSDLEKTILGRARTVRQLLRYKAHMDEAFKPVLPWAGPFANIRLSDSEEKADKKGFGAGHFISQHAFTGALGPDFPGAANIVAINQRWVHHTLHWGSAKYPWVKAGSTKFIFNALDQVLALPGAAAGKPSPSQTAVPGLSELTAFVMGYCSSVAAHVILHPFVSFVQKMNSSLRHFDVENALDAQLAIGFFQKSDLNSGDSWTRYFLSERSDWTPVLELMLQTFNATYDGPAPSDPLCALPTVDELKKQFPNLETLIKQSPDIEKALARYQGYDKLFDALASPLAGAVAKQQFDQAKGLKDFLTGYRCRVPKLDRDFLEDGWRNTLKWAIDEGYDKGPAIFRWFWFFLLAFEGWYVVFKNVSGLSSFSTILETVTFGAVKHPDSPDIAKDNLDSWQDKGIASPTLYLDPIASSYDPGITNVLTIFNLLITGLGPVWDGIFGQGTGGFGESTTGEKVWKVSEIVYKVGSKGISEIWPKATESNVFKVIDFLVSFTLDTLDALVFGARDEKTGKEGDVLGRQLWYLQLMRWPFHFVACFVALAVKHGQKGDDGKRESSYTFWDFLFSQVFALFASVLLVFWRKEFENRILGVAGARWPTTNTQPIWPYLLTAPSDSLQKLTDGMATVKVLLFSDAALQQPAGAVNRLYPDNKKAYPADGDGAQEFGSGYSLLKLFDRTKYLSGLLSMTAIHYSTSAATDKKAVRDIFDDWNLDYRTEVEWKMLMETVDGKPGLLEATETWWSDVKANRASDRTVLNRLQSFFGTKQTTGTKAGGVKVSLQYEDGSPMGNAQFEAEFGDMRVPGQTDESGVALIDAPSELGDTYRIYLVSYPQQQVVRGA
jgi:hypothetical protein